MSLEEIIAETQQIVQPLVTKPTLKGNLLSRPPVRFIHDVMSAIASSTGYGKGLLDDAPHLQNAKALKERDDKLEYIERLIKYAVAVNGQEVDLNPAKVAAGLEPEKTNLFFQLVAKMATSNGPQVFDSALSHVLNKSDNHEQAPPPADAKEEPPQRAPSKEEEDKAAAAAAPPPQSRGGARSFKEEPEQKTGGLDVFGGSGGDGELDEFIDQCNGEIERTQTTLGEIITRPALSEKLLSRPPFRFIFDVMSEVTKATGFGDGAFTEEEQGNPKGFSKELKLQYIEKIIKLVGTHLNTMVDVRAARLVAGLDAENTNRFLQLLAVCAKHKPDSTRTVEALLRGGNDSHDENPAPAESKDNEPRPREPSPPPQQQQQQAEPAQPSSEPMMAAPKESTPSPRVADSDEKPMSKEEEEDFKAGDEDTKKSMRPKTARRRPPKVKQNVQQLDGKSDAKPAAESAARIVMEGQDVDSDDEAEAKLTSGMGMGTVADQAEGASKLVQDIEKEAKEEMKDSEAKDQDTGKGGIRMGKLKKRTVDSKKNSMASWSEEDIETLRSAVQKLCQSTNPLGKCMDYVHEDLTAMSKELDHWQQEYRNKVDELETEQKITDEELQPLRMRLLELDEQIKEQAVAINSMKAKIVKNDERVEQILHHAVQFQDSLHIQGMDSVGPFGFISSRSEFQDSYELN